MSESQFNFVSDQFEPTAIHESDRIECADGTVVPASGVYYDCKGNAFADEDDRHESDVAIVTEFLNGVDEWVTEYCTENTDYASMYDHIVNELSHEWDSPVEEWVRDNYDGSDEDVDRIVQHICENLDGGFDCEREYCRSEYAAYSGRGVCLWGTGIGEHEEQVDINSHEELKALHDDGRLDDVLDDVNCNAYVSRSCRRVKNEETGRYEYTGRETYMPYDHHRGHPTFETYHMPGGRWDWVVSDDRMQELLGDALDELFDDTDCDD